LADEVNPGTYHLRAVMEWNTAEIALSESNRNSKITSSGLRGVEERTSPLRC
jgi:hypothetical protein